MNKMDPLQMVMQIKQNPGKFLVQRGLNIPSGILNDPNKIIQHLMNTGQISQEQYKILYSDYISENCSEYNYY